MSNPGLHYALIEEDIENHIVILGIFNSSEQAEDHSETNPMDDPRSYRYIEVYRGVDHVATYQ